MIDFSDAYAKLDTFDVLTNIKGFEEGFKLLMPKADDQSIEELVRGCISIFSNMYRYEGHNFFERGMLSKLVSTYYKVNGDIDSLAEPIEIINEALRREKIKEDQLRDTCEESDRILIIYNKKCWQSIMNKSSFSSTLRDAIYFMLISVWNNHCYEPWKDGEVLYDNKRINDAFLRVINKELGAANNSDKQRYQFGSLVNYIIMFSDLVERLFDKEISEDEFVDEASNAIKNFSITKSGGVKTSAEIERAVKLLSEPDDEEEERFGF